MTTVDQDFTLYGGDTKKLLVVVTDGESPVSLADAFIKWGFIDGDEVIVKTTDNGIVVTDAAAGKFEVTVSPIDTVFRSGTYPHEAEIVDASGQVSTVLTGNMFVKRSRI